jgi:hypothetical protein
MSLTKEALLARTKVKEITLEDGTTVFLKQLPASFFLGENKDTGGAAQIASSLCDKGGKLLFDPATETDAVLSMPLEEFKFLIREIAEHNGLFFPDEDKAATIAEKN